MEQEIIPYERKVYYYETDKMGIVHHSNYVRWLEEARIEYLKQIGLPYEELEEQDILIPVLGVALEYKLAFRFGDTFRIELMPREFKGIKFSMLYEIYHAETDMLHTIGETKHCFVDKNLAPVRLKKEYPQIYSKLFSRIEQK